MIAHTCNKEFLVVNFSITVLFTPCRTSVKSRQIFQQLNTLLAHLGAPNYRRARALASSSAPRGTIISSQLEEFLDSMANECEEKALRSIKAKEVFYRGGCSKAGNPVYYWIVRKFR